MDYKSSKCGGALRIALTGAGGFLGKQIIRCALNEGAEDVIAITSNTGRLKKCFSQFDKLTVVDIEDFFDQRYFFAPNTVLVNCLFPTNANGYKMADGLAKVYQCFSRAKEAGVAAVVNISSQSVYASNRSDPAKEIDTLCLESAYAVGKYSSEMYCNRVCKNILHTNIRLSSLIGVGYDARIANRLIIQALNKETIKILGGMQRYSLLDVRDAASGIVKLARNLKDDWRDTYNLGSNESISLIELIELIADVMNQYGIQIEYKVADGSDRRNSSIDCNRFMQDFNWRPKVSLRQSLTEILEEKLTGRGESNG